MTQRDIIIEHAMNMFVAQGIKAVRMDDIARELSVSKRTLYELFGDKEELLYQSIIRYVERGNERRHKKMSEVSNELERIIVCLRDMISNAPTACRMRRNMLRFYPTVYHRLDEVAQQQTHRELQAWLTKSIEDGYVTQTANSRLVIKVLMDISQGALLAELHERENANEVIEMLTYSLIIFIRGLCTIKGIEVIDRCFYDYFHNTEA